MNGHFGVTDAIKAFLFNTLIEGGVAKLEAKLHAVKHQTLIAVADRDGRVVESLKQRGVLLVPTRVPESRRKPEQLHGMTSGIAKLPCPHAIGQPLRCLRDRSHDRHQLFRRTLQITHHNRDMLEPETVGNPGVLLLNGVNAFEADVVKALITQSVVMHGGLTLKQAETALKVVPLQQSLPVIHNAQKRKERVKASAGGERKSHSLNGRRLALNIDHEWIVSAEVVLAPFTHETLPRSVKPANECLFVSDRHDHPGPKSDDLPLSA